MGVTHFAGLGRSPGAVTCALAYLVRNYKNKLPGIGSIVENVVLLASEEIRQGATPETRTQKYIYNKYLTEKPEKQGENENVIEVILDFIKKEIAPEMEKKSKVYFCKVDPYDFDNCFEQISRAFLQLSPPGETGKHIWANITGGTNPLNAALLQAATLSDLVAKIYYTFISRREDTQYLQPFTTDQSRFRWREIPLIKTAFDQNYYKVLEELEGKGEIEDKNLLSILKKNYPESFSGIDLQTFRRDWLNKLDGRGIQANKPFISLSPDGEKILSRLRDPLFRALIGKKSLPEKIEVLEELWEKK